ncbi:MAG: hypothetical protein OEZ48_01495 [Candidatus Bathyarchaeota archaeon]|nr:hypothetical protein [Candidatus Bathyarchaeota archaeon]
MRGEEGFDLGPESGGQGSHSLKRRRQESGNLVFPMATGRGRLESPAAEKPDGHEPRRGEGKTPECPECGKSMRPRNGKTKTTFACDNEECHVLEVRYVNGRITRIKRATVL